ncbi:MAG TPA: hypothetical protein VLA33_07885, partial [Gemmatimonadota bacterium]|nr:hypothetical protein [Gemmatimonadota bacterium]
MCRPKLPARKLVPLVVALQLGSAGLALTQESANRCPADLEVLVERAFAARSALDVGDALMIGDEPDASCRATVAGTFEPPADPATLTRERPR